MQIYLVGGAVRDRLLGLEVKEKDWVVVGATPEEMEKLGYRPVGKDFPVFLHPKTKEEYALARTERKSGKGYKGFICYASPDVTLEEDLKRRDITINAMASTKEGEIIDPYQGQTDLKNKVLRHVSPAFAEDPLRVLRVARFAAYLEDFQVAPETLRLMQQLSESGELLTLSPERIWKELERVMRMAAPVRFFEILSACHAKEVLFPEIQNFEILKVATDISQDPLIRLGVLLSTLHPDQIKALSSRTSIPKEHQILAILAVSNYTDVQNSLQLTPQELLSLFKKTDAFRRPERFKQYLLICQIRARAHGKDKRWDYLERLLRVLIEVKLDEAQMKQMSGKAIGEALDKKRLEVIGRVLSDRV